MVGTVLRTYKAAVDPEMGNSIITHSVLLSDTSARSVLVAPFTLTVILVNLILQMTIRLNNIGNGSPITDSFMGSEFLCALMVMLLLFSTFFTLSSLIVQSTRKSQKHCVETNSSNLGAEVSLLAHVANFSLCTPIACGLLLSLFFTHISSNSHSMSQSTDLYYPYAVSAVLGIPLFVYFFTLFLGVVRQKDIFSCSSRGPYVFHAVSLCLALTFERVRDHSLTNNAARILLILFSIAQSVWAISAVVLCIRSISFHSPKYRLVTLLGMIAISYTSLADLCQLFGLAQISQQTSILCFIWIMILSFLWLSSDQNRIDGFHFNQSDFIPQHQLNRFENRLWEQESLKEPSFLQKSFEMFSAGLGEARVGLQQSSKDNIQSNRQLENLDQKRNSFSLFAEYIFSLYNARYSQSKQQVLDIDFAFSFAHFLLKWKKHVYLLTSLHRSLTAATLSLRHAASLAVLEAAVTRQLQTQDAEFSYFFSETTAEQPTDRSKPTPNRRTNVSLDVYNIIETVSAFERLVDQMRIQLRLQTQFLSAVESRSQPVADVHSAVRVITEQRAHCKVLFDDLHAKADSAQTFHLLPFAFFLEHTENNLERRVELVKTYYFKSQVRRVHRRMFNELVDQSLTIVTESERAKLGTITHSSKNVGLVFGADIPPLEGRSLDLFFHSEMATAHRRQMRDYMQHFDRPYLGEHRERYVTVGNGVYYRVNCVTKFVPHLKHGFQFVTMMKHLTDETGKYGKMDTISIHLALNDKLNVVGIGYNHTLVKSGLLERPKPKSNLHEDTEPMSPSRKPVQRHSIMDLIGKPLSYLSPEIEQVVGDRFAEIHNLQAETAIQIQNNQYQKLKNGMQLIVPESAVLDDNPKPEEFNVPPAETPEKHKEEDDLVLESGDFMGRYDKTLNLGLNYRAPSCSDSETQSMIQEIAIDHSKHKRMALLLNFTHYCWKGFWAPEVDDVYSMMMGSFSKQTILSHSETVEKRSTTMKTTHINGNLGNGSVVPVHSGLTILRFRSPTLSDMHSFNLIQKARSSVIDSQIAADELVEFDPVSLLRNFIGKDLEIKQVNLKPDPGDQTRRKSAVFDAQDFSPAQKASRHHKPGSSFGSYLEDLPGASKDSPHGLQHAGQSQTNTALLTSRNVLSPLTNGSGGLIPQSKRATLKDYSGEISHSSSGDEKEGKTNFRIAMRNVPMKSSLTSGDPKTNKTLANLNTYGSEAPKGTTGLMPTSKTEEKQILQKKLFGNKKQGVLHKKQVQLDQLEGSKKARTREMALSVSGASSTASQTSEINTNRLIMSMIRYPSVNRYNKVFVIICSVLFWCFCHIYQSAMESAFILEFEGMGHLQNLFGVFINFDSYVKDTGMNLIARMLTKEKGFDPARYSSLNPNLLDVVKASEEEFPKHFRTAYKMQQYMTSNLTLLTQEEVERFLKDSLSLVNISIPEPHAKDKYIELGPYWMNAITKALMVLYDLRVWDEDPIVYGSWAAYHYFLDSIDTWSRLVVRLTKSFDASYKAKVLDLENLSLGLSVGGMCGVQVLLLIIFWQANTIRKSIIKIVNVVQFIKPDELDMKLGRLHILNDYLSSGLYIGSQSKESLTPTVEKLHQNSRKHRDAVKTSKVFSKNSTKQTYRDHEGNKPASLIWFGMGVWLILLALSMQIQAAINILTASRQRVVANNYLEWLHINEDYYLFVFHLNNFPIALYLDNAGKLGFFKQITELQSRIDEYGESLDASLKQLIADLQGQQANADTYGYQKFFQNPCDLIDLSIYNLPKKSCNALNSGVIKDGYIRFLDVDRLTVERLQMMYKLETEGGTNLTTRSASFRALIFHLKNIHQLMFPLVHEDLLHSANNFQHNTQEYFALYGLGLQISLTVLACGVLLIWRFVADAKLSTAVSTYLLLPAESLAGNPYIRAQLKLLKEEGK